MDDTLIHCNIYFDMVLEQFSDQMSTWFSAYRITSEEIRRKQYDIDTLGVHRFGFTADHFPKSLVETYNHFCKMTGRKSDDSDKEFLLQLGRSVYNREVEPYPYMAETLDRLREEGHTLYLYTGGVETIQRRKVESLKLERFFADRIFIRQRKTTAALDSILKDNGLDRTRTWMVGNSLRTDIIPALETGIKAIYVPAIQEWEYNMVEMTIKPKGAFFTVPVLRDVPETVSGYLRQDETEMAADM
jgi:putative hydrolase of the HAD superfamily